MYGKKQAEKIVTFPVVSDFLLLNRHRGILRQGGASILPPPSPPPPPKKKGKDRERGENLKKSVKIGKNVMGIL